MPFDLFLSLLIFAFVGAITPGPNNVLLLASGTNFGFRASLPLMAGIVSGSNLLLVIIGLGLGRALDAFPSLNTGLRLLGLLYVIWLAWRIAVSDVSADNADSGDSRPVGFVQAILLQLLNAKLWAIALTAIAAYTVPQNYAASFIILVMVFVAASVTAVCIWAGLGIGMRRILNDHIKVRIFNVTMAVLLVASFIPVALPFGFN